MSSSKPTVKKHYVLPIGKKKKQRLCTRTNMLPWLLQHWRSRCAGGATDKQTPQGCNDDRFLKMVIKSLNWALPGPQVKYIRLRVYIMFNGLSCYRGGGAVLAGRCILWAPTPVIHTTCKWIVTSAWKPSKTEMANYSIWSAFIISFKMCGLSWFRPLKIMKDLLWRVQSTTTTMRHLPQSLPGI